MKKLGMLSLVLVLIMVFAIPASAFAAEADTQPDLGTTPDSPFYFMEKWGKQISMMFTFKTEDKVNKALIYAEERLAEMEAMAERNKVKAMDRAAYEYSYCLAVATRNMKKAMVKGADTSEQVTAMMSKHIAFMYQHQYTYQQGDGACEDCQQIRQQIRERATTCQEDAVVALASQDPEAALRLNLRLTEQACNRVQSMLGQGDIGQIREALQQSERFRAKNQEMIANAEQLGLSLEIQRIVQEATSTQERFLNQIRNQYQIGSGDSTDSVIQNRVQGQQGGITTESGTDSTQGGSGPMGPAPNSGDGIPDGSGLEAPNGANTNSYGKK